MNADLSIAIETSCRPGGVALGIGRKLSNVRDFDASARHATQLIRHLDGLLTEHNLTPRDVSEVYVSTGPGSFTGLRIGITVARTLAQAVPHLRCVAVPTPAVIAENARALDWTHLAVILDAKKDRIHASLFTRKGGRIVRAGASTVVSCEEFLAHCPRPIMLIGEGLQHHQLAGPQIISSDPDFYFPTAEGVWRVGHRIATAGQFTDPAQLLPTYARLPEAVRLWNERYGPQES